MDGAEAELYRKNDDRAFEKAAFDDPRKGSSGHEEKAEDHESENGSDIEFGSEEDRNYEAEIASDRDSELGVDDVDTDNYSEAEDLDDYIENEVDDYKAEDLEKDESDGEGNNSEEVLDEKAAEKVPTLRRGSPRVVMQNIFDISPFSLFKLMETRISASADTFTVVRLCFCQTEAIFQVRVSSSDISA